VKLVKAVLSLLDAAIHTALLARVHRQLRAALQLGVVGRLDLKKDKKIKMKYYPFPQYYPFKSYNILILDKTEG
jgi:hypothetical protein